jgi:hypothetical protein
MPEKQADEKDPRDADPERQDPDLSEDHSQDGDQTEDEKRVADGVLAKEVEEPVHQTGL